MTGIHRPVHHYDEGLDRTPLQSQSLARTLARRPDLAQLYFKLAQQD